MIYCAICTIHYIGTYTEYNTIETTGVHYESLLNGFVEKVAILREILLVINVMNIHNSFTSQTARQV